MATSSPSTGNADIINNSNTAGITITTSPPPHDDNTNSTTNNNTPATVTDINGTTPAAIITSTDNSNQTTTTTPIVDSEMKDVITPTASSSPGELMNTTNTSSPTIDNGNANTSDPAPTTPAVTVNLAAITDEDQRAREQGKLENRDGKTFDFKVIIIQLVLSYLTNIDSPQYIHNYNIQYNCIIIHSLIYSSFYHHSVLFTNSNWMAITKKTV